MDTRFLRGLGGAVVALLAAACATTRPDAGGPLDGPLPPGTYELTGDVTYHADSDRFIHDAHASFGTRLHVGFDGTTELYSGQYKCVDPRTVPGYRAQREWPGGNPGHHFSCGNSSWTLWANHDGKLLGQMSATVEVSVRSGKKCIMWTFDAGRQVCQKFGYEVSSRRGTVTSPVAVKKVGG
jgi:hypothetical protein